jgi:hypothetical protein
MQLNFEYAQTIVAGGNPAAFHSPDNVIQVFYVDESGYLRAVEGETPSGDFNEVEFYGGHLVAPDEGVEMFKATYLPRMNLFALWHVPGMQRMGVFILKQEVNKYLDNGRITMVRDSPVMHLDLTLENPYGIISAEREVESEIFPGSRVNVYFRIGESGRYHLGAFYVDRVMTTTGNGKVRLEGRSITGKLLKDQTFDEDNTFPPDNIHLVIEQILDSAGVTSRKVQETEEIAGMQFAPNMTIYEGLNELLALTDGWIIRELVSGVVVAGKPDFAGFDPTGMYSFFRNKDCFSREVLRDDMDTYSRVCVHTREFDILAYRDIEFREHWNLARKKTLYVEMSDDCSQADADRFADVLKDRLSAVGVIETLVGPIRPHLQPGDTASISEPGKLARLIGSITEITHQFGRSGFSTQFVVDSGGELRKTTIKDFISKVSGRSTLGTAKKL